eukprot:2250698-Prymnesium_polylepis.1
MVARCEPEHICPSATHQTVGVMSVRLIDVIPMLTCIRTGFDGRTVPSAEVAEVQRKALSRAVQPR